jgi:hypothetical protein
VTKPDPCRFCRIYAIAVVAFAVLIGAGTAGQAAFGLRKFGGYEYIMRVVALSSVRSLAPGVAGSALLVAFVVWAHPLPVAQVELQLPRFLKRAMLVSVPGYLVAAFVAMAAGLLVVRLCGVSLTTALAGLSLIGRGDWGFGVLAALVDAALIVFLAWRYLPRLQAGRSSLPMKLVLAWTFGTGLRMTVGLLFSLLLPS